MINIKDKSKCCGCSACVNKCPKKAIEMVEDKYGFKYPQVDIEKCINCGLCDITCPYNKEYEKKEILEKSIAYGGWCTDEDIRAVSTSGGIFTSISKYIINKKGIVCGAVYDKDLNVVHDIVDNLDDLKKMNGSKYVQSDMKFNFRKIKEILDKGLYVLFSGTPCQISGLNSFLGKEYDNLYTCDIVCHGVPSPKVFVKYKKELETENNSKLTSINFRDKITGWQGYSLSTKFNNKMTFQINASKTSYMKAFLSDIDLRESCPTCKFAKLPRYADFTLGDFWGVDKCYPNLNLDNKGTSLILVHTKKGDELLNNLKDIFIQKCDLNKAIEGNPSILKHLPAHKNREKFFNELDENSLNILVQKYTKTPIYKKIVKKFKNIIKSTLYNFKLK